jgi:hypothetical protein
VPPGALHDLCGLLLPFGRKCDLGRLSAVACEHFAVQNGKSLFAAECKPSQPRERE